MASRTLERWIGLRHPRVALRLCRGPLERPLWAPKKYGRARLLATTTSIRPTPKQPPRVQQDGDDHVFKEKGWNRPDASECKSLELKKKTFRFLNAPVGSLTKPICFHGRYLLDAWLKRREIKWASQILRRWIKERQFSKDPSLSEGPLPEMLQQVMTAWKQQHPQQAPRECLALLNELEQAADAIHDSSMRPDNVAYSMAIGSLAKCPNDPSTCDAAVALFERRIQRAAASTTDKVVDTAVLNACLHVLSKCSPYQDDAALRAEKLFMNWNNPDVNSLACVLHAWARSRLPGSASRAQTILEHMLECDDGTSNHIIRPNDVCWNICIDAWANSNSTDEPNAAEHAEKLFWRMHRYSEQHPSSSVQPSGRTFSSVIHAWARSDKRDAALFAEQWLERMQEWHLDGNPLARPTTEAVSSVIDAWSRSSLPGAAERAEDLLRRMEAGGYPSPSTFSYTSVLHALANQAADDPKAPERAEKLLARMEKMGRSGKKELTPNTISYSAAIDAWSKSSVKEAPARAMTLLRRMQRNGVPINTVTWNTVISCYANHGLADDAEALLQEMSNQGDQCAPDTVTYCSVLHAFARCNDPMAGARAKSLLQCMEKLHQDGNERIRPTTVAYTAAIAAWARNRDGGLEAEALLWRMQDLWERGDEFVKPNTVTVASVMHVWSSGREAEAPERIQTLLDWMYEQCRSENKDVIPDRICFNYLLASWAKSGRIESVQRIQEILHDMMDDSINETIHPDVHSYNHLMDAIRSSSERDKAAHCHAVLQRLVRAYKGGNLALKPNQRSLHLLLDACCKADGGDQIEKDKAISVLGDAFRSIQSDNDFWNPSSLTYQLLVDACGSLGNHDSELFREIVDMCELSGKMNDDVKSAIKRASVHDLQWINS